MSNKTIGILLVIVGVLLLAGMLAWGFIGLHGHPFGLHTFGLKKLGLAGIGFVLAVIGLFLLPRGSSRKAASPQA